MKTETEFEIQYGNSTIQFSLNYSARRTLGISVYPDQTVKVTAPANCELDKVITKVEKKAGWIQKQKRKYASLDRPTWTPEYVSGETFYFLGRRYRLRVLKGKDSVKLSGKFFLVTVSDKSKKGVVKKLLDAWFKNHANEILKNRFERWQSIIKNERIDFNSIIVRKMQMRWGSCTEKGNLILNSELIRVPVDCIDYVIVHEICHLKYLKHNNRFYNLLTKYIPDWEKRKIKLEKDYR